MINGIQLTAVEAVEKFTLEGLYGRSVVVIENQQVPVFGTIVNEKDVVDDEPQPRVLFYVEVQMGDDFGVVRVFDCETIVLLELVNSNVHPDDFAVERFAAAMKQKLAAARAKGRTGWEDKEQCSASELAVALVKHAAKGNHGTFEDVANFAMMLHQRNEAPETLAFAFDGIVLGLMKKQVEKLVQLNGFLQIEGIGQVGDSVIDSTIAHIQKLHQERAVTHSEIADFAASIDSMMLDPKCTPEVVARRLMDAINSVIPKPTAGKSLAQKPVGSEGGAA